MCEWCCGTIDSAAVPFGDDWFLVRQEKYEVKKIDGGGCVVLIHPFDDVMSLRVRSGMVSTSGTHPLPL